MSNNLEEYYFKSPIKMIYKEVQLFIFLYISNYSNI